MNINFMKYLLLLSLGLLYSCGTIKKEEKNTVVSIQNNQFLINGIPTYKDKSWHGNTIEGLLFNSRMVNGIFDDLNPTTRENYKYPDTQKWDPDRNTHEFVKNMQLWKSYGLNSFTINLQGGSPTGYGNGKTINSAFDPKGNLDPSYFKRLRKILDRANELEMVVILGYFYFGHDQYLKDEEAVINGVKNATEWILNRGYQNVLVEINNECNVKSYDHEILKVDRVHELIEFVKSIRIYNRRLLVSTSYKGCYVPHKDVVSVSDFILLHGNGARPKKIKRMVSETKQVKGYKGQPIVFNEDDNYNFSDTKNNFKSAIESYASWGYFDFRRVGKRAKKEGVKEETDMNIGYQSVPVNWGINHKRKQDFFNYLKEITQEK